MRIGLQIPHFHQIESPAQIGPWLVEIAKAADEAGFASLWVMDHFFQLGNFPWLSPFDAPMLEGYTTISYLAAVTRRIRLGLLVTGVTYRHPGVLVKTVSGLDVLSGGRINLGLGAGWYQREARGLGLPFPPLKERFERLEETLQIAKQMWSDDRTPFQGKHYQLTEPVNSPQPLSTPHPPIMIGGMGPKKTLRLVAQYADACNLFGATYGPDNLKRALETLQQHCQALGRSYDTVERTVLETFNLGPDGKTDDEIIEHCQMLAELGVQHVIFNMPHAYTPAIIERVGQRILPTVTTL